MRAVPSTSKPMADLQMFPVHTKDYAPGLSFDILYREIKGASRALLGSHSACSIAYG